MPFVLTDLNPVKKFVYDEKVEESNQEWVELRLVPDSKINEFRKELGIKAKQELHAYKGRLQRVDGVDLDEDKMEKFTDKINDYAIANWKLIDEKGESIPCTSENKKFMMYGSPIFAAWINRCKESLQSELDRFQDESLGN